MRIPTHEDHCFVALHREANFYLGAEASPSVLRSRGGIHLRPGTYCRFAEYCGRELSGTEQRATRKA